MSAVRTLPETALPKIRAIVAEYYRVTVDELAGDGRHEPLVTARRVAVALARELTGLSTAEIATDFGYGHHNSTCYAVTSVAAQCATQPAFATTMEILRTACREAIAPRLDAATLVRMKRKRNLAKWGEQNHPDGTAPSARRIAKRDAAQKETDAAMKAGRCTYWMILREEFLEAGCESDPEKLIAELIDVAAVAQDWIDAILRRGERGEKTEN